MRQLFSQTLRDVPAEAEIPSHMLLLKAGLVRPLAAGIYSYLPLGRRALNKIENIIRDEIEAIGGQEITMPVVAHPSRGRAAVANSSRTPARTTSGVCAGTVRT
jgi:prolyl-tRNA synthetase